MNVTRRITAWLIPGVLFWGGCAAPALLNPTAPVSDARSEDTDDQEAGERTHTQVPPMVAAEAALIRRTAVQRGYSESEANGLAQSVLQAPRDHQDFLIQYIYAQLNQHQPPASPDQDHTMVSAAVSAAASTACGPSTPDTAHRVAPATGEPLADVTPCVQAASPIDRAAATAEKPGGGAKTAAAAPGGDRAQPDRAEPDSDPSDSDPSVEGLGQRASGANRTAARCSDTTGGLSDIDTRGSSPETSKAGVTAANQQTHLGGDTTADSAETGTNNTQLSWQRQLRQVIAHLRRELAEQEDLDPLDESRMRACLGLLQLAGEDPDQAMEALEGLDDQQQEFWRQMIMGLGILMDPNELPKMRHRVETAAEHLDFGLSALSNLGPLRVSNLAFASSVRSFGVYDEIGARGFKPGEEAILYVEVGNFTVEEVSVEPRDTTGFGRQQNDASHLPMYEAKLLGRYDILDQNQRIVMSRTLQPIMDRCRQRRRDFFIPYTFFIPKIDPGDYTLELTIEDEKGGKFGSGTIDFRVR